MLTDDFDAVFRKCCAKKPADRYATVDELADAMLHLIQQFATIDDVDQPLGLGYEGKSTPGKVTRNPELVGLLTTGFDSRASTRGHTAHSSVDGTVRSTVAGTVADRRSGYLLQIGTGIAITSIVVAAFVIRDWMRGDSEASLNDPNPRSGGGSGRQ